MIDFDCTRFQAWLDEGGAFAAPGGGAAPCSADEAAAHRHAATCPACGAELAAEQGLARVLAAPAVPTPAPFANFTDLVLARIAHVPQDRPAFAAAPALAASAVPWWVRAVAQPTSALALTLAGLAVLVAPQLSGAARVAPAWSAEALAGLASALAPWIAPIAAWAMRAPYFGSALALAALPLVALASFALYRLGLHLAGHGLLSAFQAAPLRVGRA